MLNKTLKKCRKYYDRLMVVAEQTILLDVDYGVVVNCAKLGMYW